MDITDGRLLNELKDAFQDSNINLLIGSGLSTPYINLLGNIENLLTELADQKIDSDLSEIIEASLYYKYFQDVISKNIAILNSEDKTKPVFYEYVQMLQFINKLLLCRKSTILSKQINLFTTNIDIFIEKALEELSLEYNDGFNGRFLPTYNLYNFKKSSYRKSLQYDNTSEIPVFNLLKVHGSLTWVLNNSKICFSPYLDYVRDIEKIRISGNELLQVNPSSTISSLIEDAKKLKPYRRKLIRSFLTNYKRLLIVNPTKEKFARTLFEEMYYEMLRIFSNELEKENTTLFVMGFSFLDAHIKELTQRAADVNPTLFIYIVAHTSESKNKYEEIFNIKTLKNHNIKIITPPQEQKEKDKPPEDQYSNDLTNINEKIFSALHKAIEEENYKVKHQDNKGYGQ